MQTRRRELLFLVLISLCSLAATLASAQVEVEDGDSAGALVHPQPEGMMRAESLSFSGSGGRLITLDLQHAPLKDALRAVARQAEVQLIYNDRDIPPGRLVTVTMSDATVEQALTLVLRGTELRARPTDDGILIERQANRERAERRTLQGSLSGRVTDAATGRPIAAVKVRLEEAALPTTTGAEGTYRFPAVPAGTYTLTARQIGYERATRTVVVVDGEEETADIALIPAPTILDQVVTTGTVIPTEVKALPTPINVITSDEIARQHPLTLPAVIRAAVPTAVAFNTPSAPENTLISVRGASSLLSGSGNMKVFVDGIDVSDNTLTPVDPANIERVEVVRGPQASTIYGADAAGGVIQIFTKRGDMGLLRPRMDATMIVGVAETPYTGFNGVLRQEYKGSVRGGSDGASYNFGAGYTRLADYAPENGDTRQSTPRVYGGMRLVRGMFTADLSARYTQTSSPVAENPGVRASGFVPESRPLYELGHFVNDAYAARLTASPATWWRNQLTIGIDRNTVRNVQTQPRLTTPDDTLLSLYDSRSRKLSVGYSSTVTGALHSDVAGSLTVGIDHYSLDEGALYTSQALNTTNEIQTSPPGALSQSFYGTTNTGYFAQAQVSLRDAMFLTAGVRAEDNSSFGTEYGTVVLPRLGLSLANDIGPTTVKLRGSYGKAFRAPSAGLAAGRVSASSIKLANPQLAPERQQGWDAGFDVSSGNAWSLSLTAFNQTAIDLIAFLQLAADPLPTSQYRNIGRVSNKGIEVEGTLGLSDVLRLAVQYGYVHSRIEAVGSAGGQVEPGDEPVGVPTHTAGATLTVTPRVGTSVAAGMSYVGRYRQLDAMAVYKCLATFNANDCPASFMSDFSLRGFVGYYPGFAKFNATITQQITPHFEAFLSVDNLTNKEAFEPTNAVAVIGRTTMVGLHVSY